MRIEYELNLNGTLLAIAPFLMRSAVKFPEKDVS